MDGAGTNDRSHPSNPAPDAPSEIWSYLGVGCLTAIIGLAGGGMIGVLVAKIAGAIQGCVVDPDTRAPCDWDQYWTWGARIGLVVVPVISIWRLRRARRPRRDTD